MAYITKTLVRNFNKAVFDGVTPAARLVWDSLHTPEDKEFDIFLSHSYKDADLVCGTKAMLEIFGYTVYVDWIIDRFLDRESVTPDTAENLRQRMRQCQSLLYMATDNASDSKWMPWELGYFDGYNGNVAILPVMERENSPFLGQEYLGIYPVVEIDKLTGAHLSVKNIDSYQKTKFDTWLKTRRNNIYA